MYPISIEYATIRLLDELYQIEKQCFKREAFTKQQIAYLLTDYNSISFMAYMDGEIAGFIIGRIETENSHQIGHIITIDVASKFRRKGVAKKLIQKIEETVKQQGAKECRLEVREDNIAAISLYQMLGYIKIAKLENYYLTTHGLYLKKVLQ